MMSYADTMQLLTRCQEGDSLAIESLVQTYTPLVYRLALSILDDPAEADEATQDALVAALSKLSSYRGQAKFTTWLYTITLNVCRGRLRKRRSQARLAQILEALYRLTGEHETHPEQTAIHNETYTRLWQAISALDDRRREAIILRYYHELPLQEIGQVLGVSERTVRTWLHTAHEQMRVMLIDGEQRQ
jgi:RNA polymerase sigma-70 factor (ECF subfamily)